MFRLVRITESVEKDDKVDKLIDAVLRIYKNELNDDEVVRLVSNLRKQANDIIGQRKKVDMMINNNDEVEEPEIHDWEDQVTTNKSPVTDDAEIEPAEKVSHPDNSSDEIEEDETDLENDPDYEKAEETTEESEESEDENDDEDEKSEDSKDEEVGEDESEEETSEEDSEEDKSEESDDKEKKDKKSKKSAKDKKSTKNEGFRLIRIS